MDKKKLLIGGGILAALLIAMYYKNKKKKTEVVIVDDTCSGGVKNDKGVCAYPKQYVFNQDYSALVPTMNPTQPENPDKEFKTGDVIKGYLNTEIFPDRELGNAETPILIITQIDGSVPDIGMTGQVWLNIPIEVLTEQGNLNFSNLDGTSDFDSAYNECWVKWYGTRYQPFPTTNHSIGFVLCLKAKGWNLNGTYIGTSIGQPKGQPKSTKTIVREGVDKTNGRTVVEYSDGTRGYK
jgi:hypothetical protein